MQRIGIIDIGSNSARLVIADIYKNGAYKMFFNQKNSLRLGQRFDDCNKFTDEAVNDLIETMKSFAYMCKIYKTDKIMAVATAAMRKAVNGSEVLAKILEQTGIDMNIISGEQEAYLSYLGVANTVDVKSGIVFDLGGGSTEIILFKERKLIESVSIPIGAVNLTAMFNTKEAMSPALLEVVEQFIKSKLDQHPWLKQNNLPLIAVGGTGRTVAKVIQRAAKHPVTKLHNYPYSLETYNEFFQKIITTNLEQRRKISGLSKERSDIILAGICIIKGLLEVTGAKKIITSGCGLREGLFYKYYSTAKNKPEIAPDILVESTENMLNLYEMNQEHARHVTELALAMFDSWEKVHGLGQDYRKLLRTAALLHDIGISINYYSHARHSAYMIQNAKLFGLSHKEQYMVSIIAGWHNGYSKNYFKEAIANNVLPENDWQILVKLAVILCLAESLDYTNSKFVQKIEATQSNNEAVLTIFAPDYPEIEMQEINEHKSWFKKAMGMNLVVNFRSTTDEEVK